MRYLFTTLALALFAGSALAADHPPVGTVVIARDTGLAMEHLGGGKFKEVSVSQKMPAAKAGCTNCTSCGAGCNCFGGGYYCADGKCPVQFGRVGYVQPNPPSLPQSAYSLPGSATGGCPGGRCGISQSQPRLLAFPRR